MYRLIKSGLGIFHLLSIIVFMFALKMEVTWKILRERLAKTMPSYVEPRGEFITRLEAAVDWMNRTQKRRLKYMTLVT